MGVAPPPLEPSATSPQRSPVFVRAGTSVPDADSPQVPRVALPSRPPSSLAGSERPLDADASLASTTGQLQRVRRVLGSHPVLWMLLAPGVLAVAAIALLRVNATHHALNSPRSNTRPANVASSSSGAVPTESAAEHLARLASRPPQSLNARELALLAEARADQARVAGQALREKVERNPALGKDPALQTELLRLADDPRTALDALSAMVALDGATGADLLYEVWTRTAVRSDATDLARALLYSRDVRPKASPALAVALELRSAETCEENKNILPKALQDGDRRSAHLLQKLSAKHGCGAKKREDCYACLRDQRDELSATINAVKSRRPPEFGAP